MRIGQSTGFALTQIGGTEKDAIAQESARDSIRLSGVSKEVAIGTAQNSRAVIINDESGTFTGVSGIGGNMSIPFRNRFLKAISSAMPTGVNVSVSLVSVSLTGMIVKRADGLSGQATKVCYVARGY